MQEGYIRNTLRLWSIVFLSNIAGAMLFAFLAAGTGGVAPRGAGEPHRTRQKGVSPGAFMHVFWSGVLGLSEKLHVAVYNREFSSNVELRCGAREF